MGQYFSNVAILLAAGSGRRAGKKKQFEKAGGRSLLEWAARPFLECREVHGIIVVVPKAQLRRVQKNAPVAFGDALIDVVTGGNTRHESSRAGLAALPESCETVLIHDVARPFATSTLVRRVLRAAKDDGAAVPGLEMVDSICESKDGTTVWAYVDRERYRRLQTPQGFRRDLIERAFESIADEDWPDDASAVLAAGIGVSIVEGEETNIKVTTKTELGEAIRRLGKGFLR
jgi:2-C-methyl-D-erythritol 4-phosphate cytidylyltransferase